MVKLNLFIQNMDLSSISETEMRKTRGGVSSREGEPIEMPECTDDPLLF